MSAPLLGHNLVRLLYLDEAGISKPEEEPFLVVAGMIVHGDRDWIPLDAYIESLINEFIPEEDREDFVFHATELFSGGKYFSRDKWPRERRWEILRRVVAIPHKFHLPIIYGFADRAAHAAETAQSGSTFDARTSAHFAAFSSCLMKAERWMLDYCKDDVAMVIAEDTPKVKPFLKTAMKMLRDPRKVARLGLSEIPDLPMKKIVDTVHFAGKLESRPLQVADACAFVIKRQLMRRGDINSFFELIQPAISRINNEI